MFIELFVLEYSGTNRKKYFFFFDRWGYALRKSVISERFSVFFVVVALQLIALKEIYLFIWSERTNWPISPVFVMALPPFNVDNNKKIPVESWSALFHVDVNSTLMQINHSVFKSNSERCRTLTHESEAVRKTPANVKMEIFISAEK